MLFEPGPAAAEMQCCVIPISPLDKRKRCRQDEKDIKQRSLQSRLLDRKAEPKSQFCCRDEEEEEENQSREWCYGMNGYPRTTNRLGEPKMWISSALDGSIQPIIVVG
jgi:hypothetical protein